ncbi:unnamed protein product [Trifolium pratense]|uniref:Uncharacterized protein n=1 Tax=Trifolium pratense TaxID=57577 RepID=A0ACB0JV91_TRIPR|nr:unnamed protein product [Trifolium pratense]
MRKLVKLCCWDIRQALTAPRSFLVPTGFSSLKGKRGRKQLQTWLRYFECLKKGSRKVLTFNDQIQFFNGETPGILDIVDAATCCTRKAFYEACNIEVFTPEMT